MVGCIRATRPGQVLSWTAKFNGGSAYIQLEYPYTDAPSPPYLLEPTIAH